MDRNLASATSIIAAIREVLGSALCARLDAARALSRARFGAAVTFYTPGMIRMGDRASRYPAVSITGPRCELRCAHCAGKLLESMLSADDPARLVTLARRLAGEGALGMLVSGGSDCSGRLPWARYLGALAEIKRQTPLRLSVHAGLVDLEVARGFARAGVDAVLFDVVASDSCLRGVFHLEKGVAEVEASLDALCAAGVTLYPHVVLGLAGNRFEDECRAVDLVAARGVGAISFVVFMPLRGTPLESAPPPGIDRIASVLAYARERMPEAVQALGCARPRTAFGERVEAVALLAGVTRLAVPTLGAERAAAELELAVTRQESCCSIDLFEPCTGR